MMVMPLGPDFAKALQIPNSELGIIGGSYTFSAAFSGVICAFFLDHFDRKKILLFLLLGLGTATILGGFAWSFHSLIAARILAGLFGGPASSVSISIISDTIPHERRGKAMGKVSASFAIASIFGVPLGLEMAKLGGWNTAFYMTGALAVIVFFLTFKWLPNMTEHLNLSSSPKISDLADLLKRKEVLISFFTMSLVMVGSFMLIPNFSSYVQFNAGYPRDQLGLLYFVGGLASFVMMQVAGKWVDRAGTFRVVTFMTVILCLNIYLGFYYEVPMIPIMVMFITYMVPQSIRNVACNTLITKIPRQKERARFQSMQSAVQHLACALGAFFGAYFLTSDATGKLQGVHQLSIGSIVIAIIVVPLIYLIEDKIKKQAF